jgi:hypothetical protein
VGNDPDFKVRIGAKCCQHTYVDYGIGANGKPVGVGLFNTNACKGDRPEDESGKPFKAPKNCLFCYKLSTVNIETSKGETKPASEATDDEIWNCIKNHQLSHDYNEALYNCGHWAREATAACGLTCTAILYEKARRKRYFDTIRK